MALVPTYTCNQLAPLSLNLPRYLGNGTISEKELFNTKYGLIFSTVFVRTFLTLRRNL